MVCRTKPTKGTMSVYKYATLNVVVAGKRFTLAAIPVEKHMSKVLIVYKLIKQARKMIKIRNVYVDRWFFSIDVVNLLKKYGLKFLMPARRTEKIKRIMKKVKPPRLYNYTMGNQYQGYATIYLYVVNDENGIKRVFATNIYVKEENASELFNLYSKRWGVETSYRVKNEFRAKTTSKRYSVRLFYFLFSVCLYNLWVLINVFIGVTFCKNFEKPLVTAKMFGTILYMIPIDPG